MSTTTAIIVVFILIAYFFIEEKRLRKAKEKFNKDHEITELTDYDCRTAYEIMHGKKKPDPIIIEKESEEWKLEQIKKSKNYKEYLKTLQWHELKKQVYIRDNYRCKQCQRDLKTVTGNVHHTTYERVYCENLEDLELVCKECHNLIHTYYAKLMPLSTKFNLLSAQQYIEAVELSNNKINSNLTI